MKDKLSFGKRQAAGSYNIGDSVFHEITKMQKSDDKTNQKAPHAFSCFIVYLSLCIKLILFMIKLRIRLKNTDKPTSILHYIDFQYINI